VLLADFHLGMHATTLFECLEICGVDTVASAPIRFTCDIERWQLSGTDPDEHRLRVAAEPEPLGDLPGCEP